MIPGKIKETASSIQANVEKVIIGKVGVIEAVITAIVAGGHVLLEDVPGTGKTVLAKSIAKSIQAGFKRIQFTPDLLPSDLIGMNVYNPKTGDFTLRKGPVFTNILLADEINRATPRTQSSLLECMEERQVTIDGISHLLEEPFLVLATENPVETQGTFPLPEAQLDRFLMKLSMGYLTPDENKSLFRRFIQDNPIENLTAVSTVDDIIAAKRNFNKVHVSDELQDYIIAIAQKTLNHSFVSLGISPRGSLALLKAVQAYAAVQGRDFVSPDDVKKMALLVLPHRLLIKDMQRINGINGTKIIQEILGEIPVPTEKFQ